MTACTLLVIQVRKNFKAKTEIVCVIGRVKKVFVKNRTSLSISTLGGFHLHILVFSLVYQLNSRIGVLVQSSFANDQFRRISATFQHHFKIYLSWFLHEKECSFNADLFCCTETDTGSVASRAKTELTSSKYD